MSILLKVTTNWRAGCKKSACPVRREGRSFPSSLPLSLACEFSTLGLSKFEFVAIDERQPTRFDNVVRNADRAPVILMIR